MLKNRAKVPDGRSFFDFEMPRLVPLDSNLTGACFFLMKLLPARVILDEAERAGELRPGGTVIETTSGTFGLALAMLCRVRGYRLFLVSDPAIDVKLERRLRELGAQIDIVREPMPQGGYQMARLNRMRALLVEHSGAFWPSQYENRANPASYGLAADYLAARRSAIDILVGTVGSGGSMSGLTRSLRQRNPNLISVAVDTPNSIIFGQTDGKRLLRGLGNSLMPANVDHTQFDDVHWVGAIPAFAATRALHRDHGLFMGGTSGAAYLVAQWYAAMFPDRHVVAIFPDEGHRYIDTIYDDDWLSAIPEWTGTLPTRPVLTDDPHHADPTWAWMKWNRRRIDTLPTPVREVA